jgi:hypothetical protein
VPLSSRSIFASYDFKSKADKVGYYYLFGGVLKCFEALKWLSFFVSQPENPPWCLCHLV